jgi:Ala-tRNA(Pro) deacylase
MAISTTLKNYLDSRHIAYETLSHAHTSTSMQTAEAAHVSGEAVAKAVLLAEGDKYLLAVVPATHRIEFAWINRQLGHSAGLAMEDEIKDLFKDCETGAIPACGAPYGLDVIVDDALLGRSEVCFESGDHEHLIRVSGDAFRELTRGAETGAISQHV